MVLNQRPASLNRFQILLDATVIDVTNYDTPKSSLLNKSSKSRTEINERRREGKKNVSRKNKN
jgi:hypothetical protein